MLLNTLQDESFYNRLVKKEDAIKLLILSKTKAITTSPSVSPEAQALLILSKTKAITTNQW